MSLDRVSGSHSAASVRASVRHRFSMYAQCMTSDVKLLVPRLLDGSQIELGGNQGPLQSILENGT